MINQHRDEQDLEWVTRSAVNGCIQRMPKRVTTIRKRPQGSTDPESKWAKWRDRWTTQLLLRMGKDVDISKWRDKNGDLPDCFNIEKLTKIEPEAITWWDEVHKTCVVGDITSRTTHQVQESKMYEADINKKHVLKTNLTYHFLPRLIVVSSGRTLFDLTFFGGTSGRT